MASAEGEREAETALVPAAPPASEPAPSAALSFLCPVRTAFAASAEEDEGYHEEHKCAEKGRETARF